MFLTNSYTVLIPHPIQVSMNPYFKVTIFSIMGFLPINTAVVRLLLICTGSPFH